MNLKDCKVLVMLNMHTGVVPTNKDEEILRDILEIACPSRRYEWEYADEFIQSLSEKGFDFRSCVFVPNFYIHVVGGYSVCFTATTISGFFKGCVENNIQVDI